MPKKIDITGQKFGRWTALTEAPTRANRQRYWNCRCECGTEKEVALYNLIKGKSLSCGCYKKKDDLTGLRFGRLTVVGEAPPHRQPNGSPVRMWYCNCDCGTKNHIVRGSILKAGDSTSCGCKLINNVYHRPHMDLTGKIYGHWHVLYELEPRSKTSGAPDRIWMCECDCEFHTIQPVLQRSLLYGKSKSCSKCSRRKPNYKNRKTNNYDLNGKFGKGWDSKGNEFWFDLEDYEKIKDFCWVKATGGYFRATKRDMSGKPIQLHRLILGLDNTSFKEAVPDHIGGKESRYDNRKSNLRVATQSENKFNIPTRSNSQTGVTGVCWSNEKMKWRAYINFNGKQKNLGYFDNFNDAVDSRIMAENELFKDYSFNNSQMIYNQNKEVI